MVWRSKGQWQRSHAIRLSHCLAWFALPTASYLKKLVTPLSTLGQVSLVRLIVIGGKAPKVPNVDVVEIDWHERTELELINSFDVAVMLSPDTEWTSGKCAFKLIQYMACSVLVIASAADANIDVVNSECGLLVATPQKWIAALQQLRDQKSLRINMGEAGRAHIMQNYSPYQNLPLFANVINNISRMAN